MHVRETLNQLGIEPKKSLGQNFMVQPGALRRMAEVADLHPDDAVLEIGAGLGALTDELAERARRVVALEIDERFLDHLRAHFAAMAGVEIVAGDVLDQNISALMGPDASHYKAVANVPYYITSAILRHLLESDAPPVLTVLTVQSEVADRVTARPGDMSLLAVSVQFYGEPETVTRLSAANFYPQPDVGSAILRITPYPNGPLLPTADAPAFFQVVRAGFSQPRKQVKNSLQAGLNASRGAVLGWLEAAGIDPRRRAETLSVAEWVALYEAQQGEEQA